jgi:acyl-CoA synthetase (AMP-forming)/AMP-acid ligase II
MSRYDAEGSFRRIKRRGCDAFLARGDDQLENARPQDATTIPGWIEALAAAYEDACCLTSDTRSISYRELDESSARFARGLLAHGIGKGSRVGLLFGNGTEWVEWWAAITRIGALCVPVSTFLQPAELARVVRHADLGMLIATRHFLNRDFEQVIEHTFPTLASSAEPELALAEAPFLRSIVVDGASAVWARDPASITDAGNHAVWADILANAQREVHEDDDAICIYTSGQSAEPKGVVHSQGTVVLKAHYLREMFQFTAATQTDVTMPFFWVGGLVMALFPTMDAGGVTQCTERSTWGSGAVIGNAKSAASADNAYAAFFKVPALGMTETFGMYSWGNELPVSDYPIAAPIDILQPGFDLRIGDEEGNEVPDGRPGEMLVRGPTLATRLHKVRRGEVFTVDGFYRTGDRGIRHGSRVSFLGRIGDMIKTSGANVSPAEVERELIGISGVAVAHVVALDDEARGQMVAAAVVLDADAALTSDDIRRQLRERLSVYKVPRILTILDSVDEIPMTPSLKVRKRELAALIEQRNEMEREATNGSAGSE